MNHFFLHAQTLPEFFENPLWDSPESWHLNTIRVDFWRDIPPTIRCCYFCCWIFPSKKCHHPPPPKNETTKPNSPTKMDFLFFSLSIFLAKKTQNHHFVRCSQPGNPAVLGWSWRMKPGEVPSAQAQYADFQVNDPFAKVGLFKGNKHAVFFSKMPGGGMIGIEVVGFLVMAFSVFVCFWWLETCWGWMHISIWQISVVDDQSSKDDR